MAKAFQKVFPYPAMARLCLSKIQVTKTKFILAQFQYSFQSAEMISKCFGNSSVPAVFLGCKRHDQQHEVIVGDFYWGPINLRNTDNSTTVRQYPTTTHQAYFSSVPHQTCTNSTMALPILLFMPQVAVSTQMKQYSGNYCQGPPNLLNCSILTQEE